MITALFDAKAISYDTNQPTRLKSGTLSPLYIDNRKLLFNPYAWNTIIVALKSLVKLKDLKFDCIMGVPTGGTSHAAALSYTMRRPLLNKTINPNGKHILLVEDHVSTGQSVLNNALALKIVGATITDVISITQAVSPISLKKHEINLHSLVLAEDIRKRLDK